MKINIEFYSDECGADALLEAATAMYKAQRAADENVRSPVGALVDIGGVAPAHVEAPEDEQPDPAGTPGGDGAAPDPASLAAVIAETDAQYKRTAAVSVGGVTMKEGDEVRVFDTGEVGVIAATYRGRAVVEFENGTAEVWMSSALEAVPQEPEEEPEPKPEAPVRRRRAVPQPEPEEEPEDEPEEEPELEPEDEPADQTFHPSRADLVEVAREYLEAFGLEELKKTLTVLANVTRVKSVPDDHIAKVFWEMDRALATE